MASNPATRSREGVAPGDRLLSPRATADRLGVSVRTVFALLQRGELRRVRIGGTTRVRDSDVEKLVARRTEPRGAGAPRPGERGAAGWSSRTNCDTRSVAPTAGRLQEDVDGLRYRILGLARRVDLDDPALRAALRDLHDRLVDRLRERDRLPARDKT